MMNYEVVIGLEVHIQLATNTKAFCGCSTEFESPPNTNICPVCCGYPGVLPVLNQKALSLALRVCLALGCKINRRVYFERKNYFYPDLPKNYQISQYVLPLGEDGFLQINEKKKVKIKRVHLEEDAGKLIHRGNYSLVDLNRAGIPLLEIVSEPDISSPQEAYDYLTALKRVIQYIGASSCDMEKGYLRCDANISLRKKGEEQLGVKVELKNMNSFKGVRDALTFEAKRQEQVLSKGQMIVQQTRLWNDREAKTEVMRSKEEAHDYRYFPEPDLVDFVINDQMIEQERNQVGELPFIRQKRMLEQYQLTDKEIETIISDKFLADFFEQSCQYLDDYKAISNWLLGPFLEAVNNSKIKLSEVIISPEQFTQIVKMFKEGKLNNLSAKKVLCLCLLSQDSVEEVIKREGLVQISDSNQLDEFVEKVIQENPKAVEDYLAGKEQSIMFLVGQVMRLTRGKANPKIVRKLLEKKIKS